MTSNITEIWCEYFRYKDRRKERLLLIKPIAEIYGGIDIIIYNSLAKELGLYLIE